MTTRILFSTLIVLACSKTNSPVVDAGSEPVANDGAPATDDTTPSLLVDFTVEGCPSFDPEALTCTGPVPLNLRFVPLATTTVTKYLWDFGDMSPSDSGLAPTHPYAVPGTFTVKIVATGVGGGVVTKTRTGFVIAMANPAGAPCDSDPQCAEGLFCLCPAGAACPGGPPRGMCAAYCQAGECPSGLVCSGLLTAPPPAGAAAPWQTPLCLPVCSRDTDCGPGLQCRILPPGPANRGWVRACFSDAPSDIGTPCADASGRLRNDLCSTGLCVALGAKGLCSANCQFTSCPPGSNCAVFGDGRRLCLRPCAGDFTCTQDPLLTCVVPGPGELGFSLVAPSGTGSASSYCAAKPCVSDNACRPTGTCVAETAGSHCAPRTN